MDLIIPVADIPQDNPEEQFQVILDQPINASLGEKTTCDVSVINDKSKFLKYVSYQFFDISSFLAAGEVAFEDSLPVIVQQSRETMSIGVVRTKVKQGDVRVPWHIQPFSSTSKIIENHYN